MKAIRSIIYITLFVFSLFTTTSCIENKGNYQTVSSIVGSIITDQGVKYFRSDDGYLFKATEFNTFQENDRVIASFTIYYENQPSNSYQVVTNVTAYKFPLYQIKEITAASPDTFNNDGVSNPLLFISKVGNYTYLTVQPQFYASNKNHYFALVYNTLDPKVTGSDTLKVEFRHNKKGDTSTTTWGTALMSFDLTPYMISKTSQIIRIKFNTSSSDSIIYKTAATK